MSFSEKRFDFIPLALGLLVAGLLVSATDAGPRPSGPPPPATIKKVPGGGGHNTPPPPQVRSPNQPPG